MFDKAFGLGRWRRVLSRSGGRIRYGWMSTTVGPEGVLGGVMDEEPPQPADSYEALVRARTPALLRAAYLLTGDQHLAEDLVQEALARTHRAWKRIHESSNVEAYARRVMYHTQVSWWRRRRVAES